MLSYGQTIYKKVSKGQPPTIYDEISEELSFYDHYFLSGYMQELHPIVLVCLHPLYCWSEQKQGSVCADCGRFVPVEDLSDFP